MVKHKLCATFLSLLLVASALPVTAFADEDPSSASDMIIESSGTDAEEGADAGEAGQPIEPAVQPEQPAEPEQVAPREEQPVPQPEQPVMEPAQMTAPNENSWRFENGASTTDGLVEGPLSVDERLSSSAGPAGWYEYSLGHFTGAANFRGIDVSYHQGVIDWQAVKNAGVDFAIIRCGYGDDYRDQDDAQWIANVRGAQAVGIPFGVYLYSYAKHVDTWDGSNPQSAQSEGEHVLRCLREAGLGPSDVALPVYYDMEDSSMGTDYAGMARRFCDIVGGAGYQTGIYASKSWWETKLTDGYFDHVTRWVAQYNSYAGLQYGRFNKENDIWQFSSSGRIAGIRGNVDMNYTDRALGMVEPGEQVLADGTYTLKTALDANKAVDIAGGSKLLGGNVQVHDANNTEAQRYRIAFEGGFYTLVNVGSDMAIDVAHGSYVNGGNIWQYPQNGTDAQKWRIDRNGDGTFTLVSKKSGHALDVADAGTHNGNNIQQCRQNGTMAQKFTFEDVVVKPGEQVLPNGTYAITSHLDENMVIDVQGASVLSRANIQLYRCNDTVAQVFNLTFKDGFYMIINPNSGKALDVADGSYYCGTNVQQYGPNGTDAQKWRIDRNLDGTYTIISKKTGFVLDVAGGYTDDGTNIQQYRPNGTKAQKWRFQAMERSPLESSDTAMVNGSPAESATRLVF